VIDKPLFNIDKLMFRLVTSGTGEEESSSGYLEVYQNRHREIIIHHKGEKFLQTVSMYNLKGSLIHAVKGPRPIIPAMDIPSGIYVIRAVGDDRVYTSKILLR
jgi:hypothetical protein